MKSLKKEKFIEIFTYILVFSVFMGSNFLKFKIFNMNFNVARVLMIIASIITIMAIVKSIIKKEKLIYFKDKYVKYCIIFFVFWSIYSAISIFKSLDLKMYLITNFFICIGTVMIIYFVKFIDIEKTKHKLFNLIIVPVFINCIYYLFLFFIKNKNIGGLYHNSNDLGTVLLLAIPLIIYLIFYEKNKLLKIINIIILLVYSFSFYNIMSRGCILGCFFSIFILGIIELIKKRKQLLKGKIRKIIIMILFVVFTFVLYYFIKKYIGIIDFKPIKKPRISNHIRVNLIYNGLYFLSKGFNWLFGIGAGNSIYFLKNYSLYLTKKTYSFHNFWLDILVEYGVILLIGFIVVYIFIAIKLYKRNKEKKDKLNPFILFFWLSLAVACISSSTLITREWLWITFAIIISYINLNSKTIVNALKEIKKENKNIIFVTVLPLWSMSKGSGGKALFSTVSTYVDKGYNVFLVTNQENDYTKIKNIDEKNVYYINQEWYKNSNSFIGKLKTLKYYNEFENQSYRNLEEIIKKIGNENTIIYAYEVAAVKSCKKASNKYNIPLVTRFQGTIMANIPPTLYYKLRKYPHVQALSTKSDLVIMTDDGTQGDRVLDNYKNNSKRLFIRNGVNVLDDEIKNIDKTKLKKKLDIPNDSIVLLTVSRLEGWKKVDRSILAFNELKAKEKYRLIIIGDGAEKENLEKLTNELNLTKYINFMGSVKNEEVKEFMQFTDIFLSFYDLSNVGNPLLEALCLGKPIITYNVGDTYKIIDNKNGVLLDDVSPKNISKNIEKMSQKKNLEEFSKNALKYAKENLYSWEHRMEIELEEVDKLFDKGE